MFVAYKLGSAWKEETTTKGCTFSFGLTFWGMLCYWNCESIFLRNFMEQISYSNCCCSSHLVSHFEECSVGGCCEESVISFSWNFREVHFLFSLLLGFMAKVITPLNLGGFHVRLLSSSKPVSRHCKMSLLSRWHPWPNLVCIYTKPANSCFIQKKMPLESKGWRGNWYAFGTDPSKERVEIKQWNSLQCNIKAHPYQLWHLFLITPSLTPLSITFIWPCSSFSLFQACLLATGKLQELWSGPAVQLMHLIFELLFRIHTLKP